MKISNIASTLTVAAVLVVSAVPASATLIKFEDRIAFNLAAPGLLIEDFETGGSIPGPDGFAILSGALGFGSSNAAFSPGDIMPGVEFDAGLGGGSGGGSEALVLVGESTVPTLYSQALGTASPRQPLNIRLDPGQYHVGFDFWTARNFGEAVAELVLVRVYDPSDVLLQSYEVASSSQGPSFFGVSTDGAGIGRIAVFSSSATNSGVPASTTLIDSVTFGSASPGSVLGPTPGAAELPEPATWTLLLAGLALTGLRRRKKQQD